MSLSTDYCRKQPRTGHRSAHRRFDEFVQRIERVLREFNAEDFEYGLRNNGHRKITIRHAGKERAVSFPTSSKNWNAPKRVAMKVRRALVELGVTR